MSIDYKSLDALILVGGKGTRLQSVVRDRPKPMAEVAGRPFVEWLLRDLRAHGVRRVIFCTGYKSAMVETYFDDGRQWNMEVMYSRDPVPLGTAGAVRHALSLVNSDRFLVLNGDSYCHFDVSRLGEMHEVYGACATLWLVQIDNCSRYGSVTIGADGAVRAFREKIPGKNSGLINAGVYLLEREVAETIPDGQTVSMETEFLPALISRGLYAVVGDGPFLDIGTPEAYAVSDEFFASGTLI